MIFLLFFNISSLLHRRQEVPVHKAHNRQGFIKSTDFSVLVSACAVVDGEYLLKADYQHHPPELVTMLLCEDILDHHDNSLLDDDYLDHER